MTWRGALNRSPAPLRRWVLHVVDTNPNSASARGWLEDTSKVAKYVMSDADYAARDNTYRQYKEQKRKVGMHAHSSLQGLGMAMRMHARSQLAGSRRWRRPLQQQGTGHCPAQTTQAVGWGDGGGPTKAMLLRCRRTQSGRRRRSCACAGACPTKRPNRRRTCRRVASWLTWVYHPSWITMLDVLRPPQHA